MLIDGAVGNIETKLTRQRSKEMMPSRTWPDNCGSDVCPGDEKYGYPKKNRVNPASMESIKNRACKIKSDQRDEDNRRWIRDNAGT